MKKNIFKITFICSLFILAACSQNKDEMLHNLPGYWEIVKVTDQGGNTKEFKISTTIDFIELNDTTGIRTKVNPQLNGSFKNNGTTENFIVDTSKEQLLLNYDNNLGQWTEEIVTATKNKLTVINAEGKEYSYKRFEGFDFNKK